MEINGQGFETYRIPTTNTFILIISAKTGFLGCGYFNVEIANKVGDVCAIVTGVKTPEDMLEAKVIAASQAAAKLGINPGMSGREALLLMNK